MSFSPNNEIVANTYPKSLSEWEKETRILKDRVYTSYIQCRKAGGSDETAHEYHTIAVAYQKLHTTLAHINRYGSIFAPEKCRECQHGNRFHREEVDGTYRRYRKFIQLAIWSEHFQERANGKRQEEADLHSDSQDSCRER